MGRKRKKTITRKRSKTSTEPQATGNALIVIGNIIAVLLIITAFFVFLSLFAGLITEPEGDGRILHLIGQICRQYFDWSYVFIPFILLAFATHCISIKAFHIIRARVTTGFILILIAILGFTDGILGRTIKDMLIRDFSIGAYIVFFICFIVGVILFFDSSLETFFSLIWSGVKSNTKNAQEIFIGEENNKIKKKNEKESVIGDKRDLPILQKNENLNKKTEVKKGIIINEDEEDIFIKDDISSKNKNILLEEKDFNNQKEEKIIKNKGLIDDDKEEDFIKNENIIKKTKLKETKNLNLKDNSLKPVGLILDPPDEDDEIEEIDNNQNIKKLDENLDYSDNLNENEEHEEFKTPDFSTWVYPADSLLKEVLQAEANRGDVNRNAHIIEQTLQSFGIKARVAEVNKGPTVTQYALEIAMGTKLSKITSLQNDLALALAAPTGAVRIEAPIPGRSLVGVEIPNITAQMVTFKHMLTSPTFANKEDPLLVPLGYDVSGEVAVSTIAKMPHVLIAGTTGSGKSILLNAWISTILFRTRPDQVRLILVDPKRVELSLYNGVPHLLTEVIVEPEKILSALQWTVSEMENRYKQFAEVGVRNLEGYNKLENKEKKPFIIFVIDELADLMMFASKEAEECITRIAQMARATGIHLVLATQRPSVDVITGLMKANIPSRLAFNVSSMVDSRVIIDGPGAEKLLGKGDMLFMPPDQAKPRRIQGTFIDEEEVSNIVNAIKENNPEIHYASEITSKQVSISSQKNTNSSSSSSEGSDVLFNEAVSVISEFDKASASLLQRRLKIGYARAARILDELQSAGYVGNADGSKAREVLRRSGEVEV